MSNPECSWMRDEEGVVETSVWTRSGELKKQLAAMGKSPGEDTEKTSSDDSKKAPPKGGDLNTRLDGVFEEFKKSTLEDLKKVKPGELKNVWWDEEGCVKDKSGWTRSGEIKKVQINVKEVNKRLEPIFEDAGKTFTPATDEKSSLINLLVAQKIRLQAIAEVFRSIRRSRNVELCFLVDATGSMQPHIDEVRKSINTIVAKLTDTSPHVRFASIDSTAVAQELKVAFVGYRDHGDTNQFEIFSISKSIPEFKDFCSKIVASGGGDAPEDVFGGLEHAINLNWSDDAGTKVIFHICDAPCHGNTFHSGLGDSYPSGDPKGRTHTALFSRLRSQGIQYYFGKINNLTDIMIQQFSEAYGEAIVDFDVKKVDDIRESVITAVNISVSASIMGSMSTKNRVEKSYVYDKTEPDWSCRPVQEGRLVSYDLPDSIEDIIRDVSLRRRTPKLSQVKIAPNPFSKGAERVAFYGMDVSEYVEGSEEGSRPVGVKYMSEAIVLKEYLHVGRAMNSAARYEMANQLQTIADFLARKFNEKVKAHTTTTKLIKFLKIRTLGIKEGEAYRFMSCELRFSPEDKFICFTNNARYELKEETAAAIGVSEEFVQLVTAFSHWTYKVTERFLMVVDLEGIVRHVSSGEVAVLLTDPAIHCVDVTRFGPMNHGVKGMENFFEQHKCNNFCRALGLDKYLPINAK